jgi:hypothetical protein
LGSLFVQSTNTNQGCSDLEHWGFREIAPLSPFGFEQSSLARQSEMKLRVEVARHHFQAFHASNTVLSP